MNQIDGKSGATMPRQPGKVMLITHVVVSVGGLGAVAGFLVLSIAGLTSRDVSTVRGAYLSMNLIGLYLLVPLSFAALLTGLVQSLGTSWGLFRQYWTIAKLVLTIGCVGLLLLHQFMAVARAAQRVMDSSPGTMPHVNQIGEELAMKAALAILALLTTTALSVYKPWGLTSYGRRLQQKRRMMHAGTEVASPTALADAAHTPVGDQRRRLALFFGLFSGLIIALILMHHLLGHGFRGHGF